MGFLLCLLTKDLKYSETVLIVLHGVQPEVPTWVWHQDAGKVPALKEGV